MMRWIWLAAGPVLVLGVGAALLLGMPGDPPAGNMKKAGQVALPSGLEAELQEMLWDRPGGGLVYRFRFVAPRFSNPQELEVVGKDLEFLCNQVALPKLANTGPTPSQVIVSLSDKPSVFGEFTPDVIQVFEAFSINEGTCIWEMF